VRVTVTALLVFFYTVIAHAAPVATEAYLKSGKLSGVMLRPSASSPAVLIIPGSGPTDRDGNNRLGVRGSPYKLLAESLTSKGVTTVRVDKRGMFTSSGAAADASAVTISEYASDVHAWVKVIRDQTNAPCVWVAGHSEGGLVALESSRDPAGICGLILLATPGRPLGQVLREQLRLTLGGPMLVQATSVIKALEAGRRFNVYDLHPALQRLFSSSMQRYFISSFSYDPALLIADFHKPVLILHGERDMQVTVSDAKRLKQAAPEAKLVLLPNANHFFKLVKSASMAANAAAYVNPGPLAPRTADEIADFISAAKSTQ
jgi:uncharacterized protein